MDTTAVLWLYVVADTSRSDTIETAIDPEYSVGFPQYTIYDDHMISTYVRGINSGSYVRVTDLTDGHVVSQSSWGTVPGEKFEIYRDVLPSDLDNSVTLMGFRLLQTTHPIVLPVGECIRRTYNYRTGMFSEAIFTPESQGGAFGVNRGQQFAKYISRPGGFTLLSPLDFIDSKVKGLTLELADDLLLLDTVDQLTTTLPSNGLVRQSNLLPLGSDQYCYGIVGRNFFTDTTTYYGMLYRLDDRGLVESSLDIVAPLNYPTQSLVISSTDDEVLASSRSLVDGDPTVSAFPQSAIVTDHDLNVLREIPVLTVDGDTVQLLKHTRYEDQYLMAAVTRDRPECLQLCLSKMMDGDLDRCYSMCFDTAYYRPEPSGVLAYGDQALVGLRVVLDTFAVDFLGDTVLTDYSWDHEMAVDLRELGLLTSTDQIEQSIDVSLYPNPVSDRLTVDAATPISDITLTDDRGRPVHRRQLSKGSHHVELMVDQMPVGTYTVLLTMSTGVVVSRRIAIVR